MAPRGFIDSAWGQAEGRTYSFRSLLSIALVVLLLGVGIGYLVRSASHKSPDGSLAKAAVAQAAVIDPTLPAMVSADNSANGAVKAATSFITGYGDLALRTEKDRNQVLDTLIDPAAPPTVKTSLQKALTLGQQQLVTANTGTTTAKIITSPVTYRVAAGQTPTQQTVTIWFMTTYLDSNGAKVLSGWSTDDLTLKFSDHWRLLNFVSNAGPTPPVYSINGQTSTYNDVAGVLNNAYAYRSALSR